MQNNTLLNPLNNKKLLLLLYYTFQKETKKNRGYKLLEIYTETLKIKTTNRFT